MRLLYFTLFYPPENIAPAFRAHEHAIRWVQAGVDVTVFTGWPNYPTGQLAKGYQMTSLGRESAEGVRVLRLASWLLPNISTINRAVSGLSFVINGLAMMLFNNGELNSGNYDVVLVTSGTIFSAWLGCHYALCRKLPYVIEFLDLTWQQMMATGRSGRNIFVRLMKNLELSFCKKAKAVVTVTEGFKKSLVSEGVPSDIITVIPNGADIIPCSNTWSNDRLRLGYYGTIGLSQNILRSVSIAKVLNKEGLLSSYQIIGEGAKREEVQNLVDSGEYPFLSLLHGMPKEQLDSYYEKADMTVVSLLVDDNFGGTIPSKIFQSLARGIPVLFLGPEGDAAQLVRNSGGGLALIGNDNEVLDQLRSFISAPGLAGRLASMSRNGANFIEKYYTRERMAAKMLGVLESCEDIIPPAIDVMSG